MPENFFEGISDVVEDSTIFHAVIRISHLVCRRLRGSGSPPCRGAVPCRLRYISDTALNAPIGF